jgi:hypothetical protein
MGKRDFGYKNMDLKWISVIYFPKSPVGKTARCEWRGERVLRNEPRWKVNNGKGIERSKDKGVTGQWICDNCARDLSTYPTEEQQGLW